MAEKGQGQIPGTELPEIPDLEESAEAYRLIRNERQALSIKEHEQDAHLKATFDRIVRDGDITIPPDMKDGETRVLHRYQDGDGEIQDIKYTKKESKLKVNKSPVSDGASD